MAELRRRGRRAGLAQVETPGDHSGAVTVIKTVTFLIVEGQDRVRLVGASHVHFQSGYREELASITV